MESSADPQLRSRIERALEKNPEYRNGQIAHNCNTRVGIVELIREDLGIGEPPPSPRRGLKGKSIDAFRTKYDIDLIINRKVEELLNEGQEEYFDDHDFRELCRLPTQGWRRHADSPSFTDYRLKKGDLNVWGPAHIIEQMKKILGII